MSAAVRSPVAATTMRSSPAPDSTVSLPAPPVIVSDTPPPLMLSLPALPVTVSEFVDEAAPLKIRLLALLASTTRPPLLVVAPSVSL